MRIKSCVFHVYTYTYIVSNCCLFYRLKSTLTHQFLCLGSFCGENFSSLQHMELLTLTRWRVIVSACKYHGTTIQSLSELGLRCVQHGSSDEKSSALTPCKENQYSLGFWIPRCEFRIPKHRISDSRNKNLLNSGIWMTLHGA